MDYKIKCQFCGTSNNVINYIPEGDMCKTCKKNLDRIREYKLGVPQMRITKEKHKEVDKK